MFKFLIDQCVSARLASAIASWNVHHPTLALDAVSVGELPDLPLGTLDPVVLIWAERNGRVVITTDYSTMPGHFTDHLAAGRHLAGLLFLRPEATLPQLVDSLVIIAVAGVPEELFDNRMYIPL
jgi:predicted nuclease of predicted toxin-antitoxin system